MSRSQPNLAVSAASQLLRRDGAVSRSQPNLEANAESPSLGTRLLLEGAVTCSGSGLEDGLVRMAACAAIPAR